MNTINSLIEMEYFTEEEFEILVFKSKNPIVLDEDFLKQWINNRCIRQFDLHDSTPLQFAVRHNYNELAKFLIEIGADISFDDYTALFDAIDSSNFDMVKYLVEKGADVMADGNWAIMNASQHGSLDIVEYLVQKGADFAVR